MLRPGLALQVFLSTTHRPPPTHVLGPWYPRCKTSIVCRLCGCVVLLGSPSLQLACCFGSYYDAWRLRLKQHSSGVDAIAQFVHATQVAGEGL